MAKKQNGDNKSELIREKLRDNPDASPKDIAAQLKEEKGLDLTPAFVSTIKSQWKKKTGMGTTRRRGGGRKKAAAPASEAAATPKASRRSGGLSVDDVMAAKELAHKLGSVAAAKAALEAYEKIK